MHLIKVECIGDGTPRKREYGVWELTGLAHTGGFRKRAVDAHKDYSSANGVGSRGVYAYYTVQDGPVYEVKSPQSWHRTDHYYVTFGQGQEWRLSVGEVFQCLANARLASTS